MTETYLLSKSNPVVYKFIAEERKIIIDGIDIPSILSQIVGLISLQRLAIERANSSNYIIKNFDGTELCCFRDEFIINTEYIENDAWETELPRLIAKQYLLVYRNKNKQARQETIEKIAVSLTRYKDLITTMPVLDFAVKELSESKQLKIKVEGEDSPFLLYMLTCAIETQSMPISEFSINTKKGYVEDIFLVQNANKASPSELASLRFKLMLITQFTFLLQNAPDPYNALLRFQEAINKVKVEEEHALLDVFLSRSQSATAFAELLGSGDYFWEQFIRTQSNEITKFFSDIIGEHIAENSKRYSQTLCDILSNKQEYGEKIEALNKFKDDAVYRIDLDAMVNHSRDVKYLSERLSELAREVVRQAAELSEARLVEQFGYPYSSLGVKTEWVLFGLGKFGGSALGYASDIELMLLYEDVGHTKGANSISNYEFFERLVKELGKIIQARSDGIFTLDFRLRPYGDAGPLAVRLDSFIEYYQSSGVHSIELLALTRMRPICGTPRVAERVLRIKNNIIFESNAVQIDQVFTMRKKQLQNKVKKGTRNAKFGRGALVDVEYGVQMLQIQYGKEYPALMQPSIHNTLYTLEQVGKFAQEETSILIEAYQFFRKLINALRMRRGSAKDVTLPPEHSWEMEHLARRMGYQSAELSAGVQLIIDYDSISAQVIEFIEQCFQNEIAAESSKEIANPAALVYIKSIDQAPKLFEQLAKPAQTLRLIQNCARKGETRKLFSRILLVGWIRILRNGDPDLVFLTLDRLTEHMEDKELRALYRQFLEQTKMFSVIIDIFSTSRFLSEEIIKKPEYIAMLMNTPNIRKTHLQETFKANYILFEQQQILLAVKEQALESEDMLTAQARIALQKHIIREFRKQETLRIIVRDIFIKVSLKKICSEISSLAITLLQQALEYSRKQLGVSTTGLAIFAFGKLGARELNYSSDIDIVCVFNQNTSLELAEISELFKQTIQYLAEYTASGVAYRVDLRLRPFGDGGDIVSHVDALREYYQNYARQWEIQAALKLTAVAGDAALANEVYEVISTISEQRLATHTPNKILEEIRTLREKSVAVHLAAQNEDYEVKNSRGGIRDIEFGTQALQLLHYSRELCRINTLDALQLLHKKEIITEQELASNTDNYCFLRRIEHFLQVFEDKQLHAIPENNPVVIQRLTWLMMQEQDEDSFLQKLAKIKSEVLEWHKKVMNQYKELA